MLSALVRTFNSERTLCEALASLASQKPALSEVVVVDSGSSDATLQIAAEAGARIFKYPLGCPFNYSKSLNVGMTQCRSDEVLILSSHCVLGYDDIAERMRLTLRQHGAAGVYCMPSTDFSLGLESDASRGLLHNVIWTDNFTGSNGLWNCCSLVRRDLWEKHPFDESLAACEDQEWAQWHHIHSLLPTVAIRNAGVRYLNPIWSPEKDLRERLIVVDRIYPAAGSWRAIATLAVDGLCSLVARRKQESRRHLKAASLLIGRKLVRKNALSDSRPQSSN